MSLKTRKWDTSRYLDSPEIIAEYLNQSLESGNTDDILLALRNVSKAQGMTETAKKAGVSRESLYKSLDEGSRPQFETILKLIRSFDVDIKVEPRAEEASERKTLGAFVGATDEAQMSMIIERIVELTDSVSEGGPISSEILRKVSGRLSDTAKKALARLGKTVA